MEHNELIEAYFKNELSAEELKSFQERLKSEKEFADEVEDYQLITEGIKQVSEETDLLEKMKVWDEEVSAKPQRTVFIFTPIRIAAVLAPIILVSAFIIYNSSNVSSDGQDLFETYFIPYDDVISNRSNDDTDFRMAMSAYNSKDYNKALQLFDKVLETEQDTEQVNITRFYQAMAYLSNGNLDNSETLLNTVVAAKNPLFKEVSEWYLLLVYIKGNQDDEADQQIVQILSNSDHLYYQQARLLQEDLDKRE